MNFSNADWMRKSIWENASPKDFATLDGSPFFIFNSNQELVGFNSNQANIPVDFFMQFIGKKFSEIIQLLASESESISQIWNEAIEGKVQACSFALKQQLASPTFEGLLLPKNTIGGLINQVYLIFKDFNLSQKSIQILKKEEENPIVNPMPKSFLMIEDLDNHVVGLFKEFKRNGMNVLLAPTAEVALLLCEFSKPDVVITDFDLRGKMDGISFCLEYQKNCDRPVYFLSAQEEEIMSFVETETALAAMVSF